MLLDDSFEICASLGRNFVLSLTFSALFFKDEFTCMLDLFCLSELRMHRIFDFWFGDVLMCFKYPILSIKYFKPLAYFFWRLKFCFDFISVDCFISLS